MEVLEKSFVRPAAIDGSEAFEELYERAFLIFARFAGKMRAPFQDAKDIFHDAMAIYYEKAMAGGLVLRAAPEAYIVGIAKHLWIKKFRHDRHRVSLDSVESGIALTDEDLVSVNDRKLLTFLEATGKKCLDLLRNFYYGKMTMKQIAVAAGYRDERSAAVGKFKCLEKMREAVKNKSMCYEDFFE
ncbi:MAG TPA: sigma-70 family RNA polymerase sigma factor [Chryseosolibacter sp.]